VRRFGRVKRMSEQKEKRRMELEVFGKVSVA
jgi:hypothetical protein